MIAVLVVAASCGGDDGGEAPSSPTVRATGATGAVVGTADAALPKLDDLGFALVQKGRDALAAPGQEMVKALYQKPGPVGRAVIVRVYVQKDEVEAQRIFETVANAYSRLPLQALVDSDPSRPPSGSGAPASKETAGPVLGDQQRWFVTILADSQGSGIWTDVLRFGRSVAVVQLQESASSDQTQLRTDIAGRVGANLR